MRIAAVIATIGTALSVFNSAPSFSANSQIGVRLSAVDIQLYRTAFAAADRANWRRVWRITRKAENPLPAKVLRWLYLSRRGTPAGFDEIAGFVAANPDWPSQGRLVRQAEKAINGKIPAAKLLAWFAREIIGIIPVRRGRSGPDDDPLDIVRMRTEKRARIRAEMERRDVDGRSP